jgi:hypothetical protein
VLREEASWIETPSDGGCGRQRTLPQKLSSWVLRRCSCLPPILTHQLVGTSSIGKGMGVGLEGQRVRSEAKDVRGIEGSASCMDGQPLGPGHLEICLLITPPVSKCREANLVE